tara:strand:+ start:605 stop:880 length:276 start_codon:yes stop_codon:yes gene_type:complete
MNNAFSEAFNILQKKLDKQGGSAKNHVPLFAETHAGGLASRFDKRLNELHAYISGIEYLSDEFQRDFDTLIHREYGKYMMIKAKNSKYGGE